MTIDHLYPSILPTYALALVLLFGLVMEALFNYKKRVWSLPALVIYATTFIWYFVEFIYTPENLTTFTENVIRNSYLQVMLFLVSFRLLLPSFTRCFGRNAQLQWTTSIWRPERLLWLIAMVWGLLLLYGVTRMNGDIIGALFPIQSRAGGHMWGRAAAGGAGSTGFIVSTASYTYLLVCSFFGVLLPLQNRKSARAFNVLLLLVALPYFFLMGARNQLLAVLLPGYFSYALFSRQSVRMKVMVTVVGFLLLNQVLTIIIAYRNVGFTTLFDSGNLALPDVPEQKHLGLNMFEELCYINMFAQQQLLNISYGGRYLAELLNVIPRAIWAEKPLVGIDYAQLRGFGGASSDIGVFATISSGFIGQGILNFGPWLGAIAPGILLAGWAAWLARLWMQSYSTLRLCLFLAGLGITFNLGRDITLLVLFPIVFGYGLVRFLEASGRKKYQSPHAYDNASTYSSMYHHTVSKFPQNSINHRRN